MRFTRWDQVTTSEETNKAAFALSGWHLAQAGQSPQACEIRELVAQGNLMGLCSYALSYSGVTVEEYRHLRQVLALFSKRADLDLGVDTQAVAWRRAMESEAKCFETNQIFRAYNRGDFCFHPDVERVLFLAQRKIADILGDVPSLSELRFRFGPGATTNVKKKDASPRRKLAARFECSEDAIGSLPDLLAEFPVWCDINPHTDKANCEVSVKPEIIAFARKNALTKRTISKGPGLNVMFQLGIGDEIAARLKRYGMDLSDQTRNQRLAREGSLTGALATLDLSDASDLGAYGFVESMIPYDWYDLLCKARNSYAVGPDGKTFFLEKFSSMGNGFTFSLMSVLLYALALAATDVSKRKSVSVYGDDIIVPVDSVDLLVRTLHSVGYKVNLKKSYWEGPFRESCGKDYLAGIDVRPFYLKDALSGQVAFTWHNFYVRNDMPEAAALVLEYIDESLRIWGPDGFGDGHLLGDFQPIRPKESSWCGYLFETYTFKPNRKLYALGADYVYPSYSIYLRDEWPPEDYTSKRLKDVKTQRPDALQSRYARDKKGRVFLEDTVPGFQGYRRVRVYVMAPMPS